MKDNQIQSFPITVYGKLESFNDTISKGRCRIFYKGLNRNSTYISEEFANKLLATIPYTPIKGIYDEESEDFTDHGKQRNLGRIYGIVPENPNFAWEKHIDADGVEREYACVDVLYYTALYKEAGDISGKSQSMELYSKSIKGDWKIIEGKRCFVYEDACFLGLQALGDDIEPCFEGAAFYNLILDKYSNFFQQDSKGGQELMQKCLFKLSDDEKRRGLWELLNSETDEDGYRIYRYSLETVYDDYAIAYDFVDQNYIRAYYSKNDETNSIEITNKEKCYIIDVNEEEYLALNKIRESNGNTFSHIDTVVEELNASVESLNNQNSELGTKITELNNELATLTTERDNALSQVEEVNTSYAQAQEQINGLTSEVNTLAQYKKNIEDEAKLSVINNYVDVLSEDIISKYREAIDNYTCEQLDMELTYEQKKANPNMFSKTTTPVLLPKEEKAGGIESILDRYERK